MPNSKQPYQVLLSFDLEEFDIPNEYGASLPPEEQLSITKAGNKRLLPLLEEYRAAATFFTTAYYAVQYPAQIQAIAARHEIASHAFYHSRFSERDLLHSRQVLSVISGQPINGFRMPRLAPVSRLQVAAAGYRYDASLNPTWLPGRYNHLSQPRTLFRQDQLWVVPASVTPHLRIPLFWLAFKNFPLPVIKQCSLSILKKDKYLCLYFHPWEFANLSPYPNLPFYTRQPSGQRMLDKLGAYLQWLQNLAAFRTIQDFIDSNGQADNN